MYIVTDTRDQAAEINDAITDAMLAYAAAHGSTVDKYGIVGKREGVDDVQANRTDNWAIPFETVDGKWAIPQPDFSVDLSNFSYSEVETVTFPEIENL